MGQEAANDLWCNHSPLMASCPFVVWVQVRGDVGWSSEESWRHPPLLGGTAGGINPQPKAQGELSCPCVWPHDKGDYKPHPWGPMQAPFSGVIPGQHRGSGITLNSCLHWDSSHSHYPSYTSGLRCVAVLLWYFPWHPIHLLNQFRPACPVIT